MISMFNHIHTRVATGIQANTINPAGMKSLLTKLQGDESMSGIRSIWAGFVKTWNEALPDEATKIRADLVQLKKLEETVRKHVPAEKTAVAGRPYTQETAWAAYNEEYKGNRSESAHNALMTYVNGDLTPYVQSFQIITAEGSGLSREKARQMVLQRSLVDFVSDGQRRKTPAETNKAIMGCTTSYFDDHPAESAQEVAFIMKTPVKVDIGVIKNVTVLTVSAPALDDAKHPIWNNFVDQEGKLKQDVYRKHYSSMCSLIKKTSDQNPEKRVVISAVGMGAFLSALSKDQQEVARDIAADQLARLAAELKAKGRTVAYSDINTHTSNAVKIQKSVMAQGMAPLPFVGKMPGPWMNEDDLCINPGDPHSCAGNGGTKDWSVEGFLGAASLMSDIHVQVAINAQLEKTAQQ